MIPEISEFSYGFALTNELVGWHELTTAPIFPSLIEEGKKGGGYDVKLDRPGAPLYLQFKRSECMTRSSAREYRSVRAHGGSLALPFYRFPITESAKSDQHELLLALDAGPNHVYYVAPRFHRLSEINDAWNASEVASRSVFVPPSEIGSLNDERHAVAFDGATRWICSDPRQIRALNSREVLEKLQAALQEDQRPLRARLPEFVEQLRDAEMRGRERIAEKRREAEREGQARRAEREAELRRTVSISGEIESARSPALGRVSRDYTFDDLLRLEAPEPTPPPIRGPQPLKAERLALRQAADLSARLFDAQLIIVQPAE